MQGRRVIRATTLLFIHTAFVMRTTPSEGALSSSETLWVT